MKRKTLTPKQCVALTDACDRAIDPFDYGATTIATLKRRALIAPVQGGLRTFYRATDAGRAALAKIGGSTCC